MLIRHLTLLLTLTALSSSAFSQNGGYTLFRSFTVADGLPSNHIYKCVEDNEGFLWVSTESGIARFDGKRFQTFTTRDGLPDEDVLDVVKEKSGRIWVNFLKQSPAYFDKIKNRFINAKEDSNLAKVKGTGMVYLKEMPDGGVQYWNADGSYFFCDGNLTHLAYQQNNYWTYLVVKKFNDNSFIGCLVDSNSIFPSIAYIKNNKLIDSSSLAKWCATDTEVTIDGGSFYIINSKTTDSYVLSSFQINPLRFKVDSISIKEPIYWRGFSDSYFTLISIKGSVYVFDKQSLHLLFELKGNYSPVSLYDDSNGNIWIGTIDKGLLLYKKKNIETFATPDNFANTHFLSIARKFDGSFLAGNHYGQVAETDGKYFIVHSLPDGNSKSWQRKIIISQNKVFTFSENGDYINYSNTALKHFVPKSHSKTAVVLDDSTIIDGTMRGLFKLNTVTGERSKLPTFFKRTTVIAVAPGKIVYHGSTDGLYKFDYNRNSDDSLSKLHPLLGERITAICSSPDNYVWVGTSSNGLLVLKNDKVIKTFSAEDGIISNNIKCITAGRAGEVWVGTNSGISVIRYQTNPDKFTYKNLTINDGLSSNIINEMLYNNDTVYCATGDGLCAIPANITLSRFDIPVQLTGIRINNRNTNLSDNYRLKYNHGNIELHFAGIELGGHFNCFEYRINGEHWQRLEANTLILQLNSGKHTVEIRAIDVNGNAGTKPLLLSFTIATPFWKTIWFWLLVMFTAGGLIVSVLRKREIAKRELALQEMLYQKKLTELELQALKSQINPHFIFNCLNSIKLLSHQQKHKEAEKYLDKFASLLRSAMEQSSIQQITLQQEIDFIENYLSLEKLRFPDKLTYTIETSETLNAGKILIPSMLLQPYIENAIKHGIAFLKDRCGLVQVRFYEKDNLLIAEVKDNGEGILKKHRNLSRVGIGMANTERRSMFYKIETVVKDLSMPDGDQAGTLIQLSIPLQNSST